MFEEHDKLVTVGKELQKELIAKDNDLVRVREALSNVRTELNNIKAKGLPEDKQLKAVKVQLNTLEERAISTYNNITKANQRIAGIIDDIKKIKELLKL